MFPSMERIFNGMLPPELAAMLGSVMEMEEELDEPEEPQHPCAREVSTCVRETGSDSRSAIEGCLVKHITQLSAECKCFVHHITNGRVPQPQPPTAKLIVTAVPQPVAIRTVAGGANARGPAAPEPTRPVHRLSCLLIFSSLFLLSFIIMRAIFKILCCPARARAVVMVPPEHASIKTIGAPPLLVSEITKPVQVAQPLSKA